MNILKKTIAGLVVAGTVAASATSAMAYDRRVEIVNAADTSVVDIYISHIDSPVWDFDLLRGSLRPGYSVVVAPEYPEGYCRFDIEVVYADGTYADIWDVNLCEVSAIITDGYTYDVYYA